MAQRNILVPIDFSGCSIKALETATSIAKKIGTRLIIMNACPKPVAYAAPGTATLSRSLIREAESNANKAFACIKESIKELENVEHTFQIKHAFPQDAIISLTLMEEIDLIIMGTTGASGFKGRLLGSNTYTVTKNVKCPVLAIPEAAETGRYFKNIVIACDYQNTASKDTFDILINIASASGAEIQILHISEAPVIKPEETKEAQQLDRYFKHLRHSFHFKPGKHVDEGINEYIDENNIDLLTLVAKKHSLLDRIFKGSMTRKMAYHSKTPLLILHSK